MSKSEPQMNRGQRAAQIWSLLVFAARNRQIVTYGLLGKLIGVPTAALGQLMEPIQSYCMINNHPPLTVLVVSEASGLPGPGFTGTGDVAGAQMRVFTHEWLGKQVPTPEEFEAAVRQRPSNGVASADRY